jgi:hypothetical protein
MNPSKVERSRVYRLTDLPNIGKAGAADLELLGVQAPEQLIGKCPFEMYAALCALTGLRHDPCVIDVFMSVTRFMAGEAAQPWWHYTHERKQAMSSRHKPAEDGLPAKP